jgi:hypothetical protein
MVNEIAVATIRRLPLLHATTLPHTSPTNSRPRWSGVCSRPGKDGIGKDGGRPYSDLRWSHFKARDPREMYEIMDQHVFPFLRNLGGDGSLSLAALELEGARLEDL